MSHYNTFTSESVSEGHPDKMADQIDGVLVATPDHTHTPAIMAAPLATCPGASSTIASAPFF